MVCGIIKPISTFKVFQRSFSKKERKKRNHTVSSHKRNTFPYYYLFHQLHSYYTLKHWISFTLFSPTLDQFLHRQGLRRPRHQGASRRRRRDDSVLGRWQARDDELQRQLGEQGDHRWQDGSQLHRRRCYRQKDLQQGVDINCLYPCTRDQRLGNFAVTSCRPWDGPSFNFWYIIRV